MKSYFESDEHKAEFQQHLSRSSVPLKFAYAGSAATTHDALGQSSGYHEVVGSAKYEVDTLIGGLGHKLDGLTDICEIGPGNGLHSIEFLRELRERYAGFTRYLGLDFSASLVQLAIDRLHAKFPLQYQQDTWDFEVSATTAIQEWRSSSGTPVVICLLGHTLGNPDDPQGVLTNIRHSCHPGDFLLLSVATMPAEANEDNLLRPYRTKVFRDAALEPLRAAGIDTEDIELKLRVDHDQVVGEVTLPEHITALGMDIEAGTTIRCFQSRRFRVEAVHRYLSAAGWRNPYETRDSGEQHVAILVVAV